MDLLAISRISVKHLSTLHILLSTHSVTKTAEQLCVSPSSVSKILSQLRESLKDELFYRDGTHLIPTPYALKIAPSIHSVLLQMNNLINQDTFQPQEYRGKFSLAMRESTFEILSSTIAKIVAKFAPNAELEIHAKEQYGFDALLSGQVDAIILPHDRSQPVIQSKLLEWEAILDDEMVCLMHKKHPLAQEELSVEQYLSYKHIGVFDSELNQPYFEQSLKQDHQARQTNITVADFGSAAILCGETDFLFTCSKKWFEVAKQAQNLIAKPLPFDYGQVAYSIVSNKQSQNDQAISWLIKQLKSSMV